MDYIGKTFRRKFNKGIMKYSLIDQLIKEYSKQIMIMEKEKS